MTHTLDIKWPFIVLIVFILLMVVFWAFYAFKNGKLETSAILKRDGIDPLSSSPVIQQRSLLLLRVLFAVYSIVALILSNVPFHGDLYSFYTVWNYIVLILWFTVRFVLFSADICSQSNHHSLSVCSLYQYSR